MYGTAYSSGVTANTTSSYYIGTQAGTQPSALSTGTQATQIPQVAPAPSTLAQSNAAYATDYANHYALGLDTLLAEYPQVHCQDSLCLNVSASCPVTLVFIRNLTINDYGIDVVGLQRFLINSGYLTVTPTTILGTYLQKTATAVGAYQEAHGLPVTYQLDDGTRAYLNANAFTGQICFDYVRNDVVILTPTAKSSATTIAKDLTQLGLKTAAGLPFCTQPGLYCSNISSKNAFLTSIPSGDNVVTVANYLSGLSLFSKISYVNTTSSNVVLKQGQASNVMAGQTVTTSWTTSTSSVVVTVATSSSLTSTPASTGSSLMTSKQYLYGHWTLMTASGVAAPTSPSTISLIIGQGAAGNPYDTITVSACDYVTAPATITSGTMQIPTGVYFTTAAGTTCNQSTANIPELNLRAALSNSLGASYVATSKSLQVTSFNGNVFQFSH